MSTTLWCIHCRTQQLMEWRDDIRFGPGAETASCPRCGVVWGVRARRRTMETALTPRPPLPMLGEGERELTIG